MQKQIRTRSIEHDLAGRAMLIYNNERPNANAKRRIHGVKSKPSQILLSETASAMEALDLHLSRSILFEIDQA
jgi:hypothetical protein